MQSSGSGGGMALFGGSCRVAGCTITGNLAAIGGAGIEASNLDFLRIDNSIVFANTSDEPSFQIFPGGSPTTVRFSCIEGSFTGPGNIDQDPLFIDPGTGDYHVVVGSPCADAGHNNAVPLDDFDLDGDGITSERLPHDLDGNPRIVADRLDFDPGCGLGAVVDIGAFETPGTPLNDVLFADVNGDGAVDIDDLVQIVLNFGPYPGGCNFNDVDFNGQVDIDDIVAAVLNWG